MQKCLMKYKHDKKSMKASFINYADLESLIEKMSTCHNNPEAKINKHTVSGFSYFQYSIDPKKT